jgi:hypothetical protein
MGYYSDVALRVQPKQNTNINVREYFENAMKARLSPDAAEWIIRHIDVIGHPDNCYTTIVLYGVKWYSDFEERHALEDLCNELYDNEDIEGFQYCVMGEDDGDYFEICEGILEHYISVRRELDLD